MSNSLWPHGLHHARLPCPSLSPRVCSDSCELCWWCHFFAAGAQVLELWLSISPSDEYSGLISFRTDWFDPLAVQETLESFPTPQFESINSKYQQRHNRDIKRTWMRCYWDIGSFIMPGGSLSWPYSILLPNQTWACSPESESRSVTSSSLRPHGYTVHEIL